jgi:hypothetical protein
MQRRSGGVIGSLGLSQTARDKTSHQAELVLRFSGSAVQRWQALGSRPLRSKASGQAPSPVGRSAILGSKHQHSLRRAIVLARKP